MLRAVVTACCTLLKYGPVIKVNEIRGRDSQCAAARMVEVEQPGCKLFKIRLVPDDV